jgi:DNA-binding NarL/FixJ family response regulator
MVMPRGRDKGRTRAQATSSRRRARENVRARSELDADVAPDPPGVELATMLPGTSGVAAIRELRRVGFAGHILVLALLTEVAFVVDAFAAGAKGYALKEQTLEELLPAIRRVAGGHHYLAPRLEAAVAEGSWPSLAEGLGVMDGLSTREREIFNLIVAGFTNQQMASEFYISIKTVETHRSRINRKLRVHSTAELIHLAALHGLVSA